MSWSASLTGGPAAADEIQSTNFSTSPPVLDDGPQDQFEVAVDAAREIAASGALGGGPFRVSANGHWNEGHEPDSGVAADFLNVSVTRA